MAEKEYKVARPHIGDKDYAVGDTRTANPAEVAHLVANGVLIDANAVWPDEEDEEDEKTTPEAPAKAAESPETKAESPPETGETTPEAPAKAKK